MGHVNRLSRRAFVGGAGASVVGLATFTGCSLIPAALKQAKMPRIGVLLPSPDAVDPSSRSAILDGLREAGWIEGQTIWIEWRSAEGYFDRLPALAAELVGLPVALIATVSTNATAAAKQATSIIPIVFCSNGDPVGSGFVQSLARPGGNLTGTTQVSTTIAGKRLSLLKELLPALVKVAFIQDLSGWIGALEVEEIQTAALQLGVQIEIFDVRAEADLAAAFDAATHGQADALLMGGQHPEVDRRVTELVERERLPVMYPRITEVQAGGLLSYAPNQDALKRRAAAYHVDKILRGAKPADLPVEQPTTIELAVNQTTAKSLGLTLPPAFVAQVTEWVE
jgi:putative ABC transport system substrate-binding protein